MWCVTDKVDYWVSVGRMVGMSTPPTDLAAAWLDHQRAEGVTPNTVAARARVLRSLPDGLNYPADVGRILRMIEPTRWDRDR